MAEAPYTGRRANPRFSFFADAEVTLRDGVGVRAQLRADAKINVLYQSFLDH